MVESLITSPDFWRQSGKYESKMLALKAHLATLPRADKAPMLVWTTLEKAINGWCVEEYRMHQYWSHPESMRFVISGLSVANMQDEIRRGNITITPSHFGGSDTAVTITYQARGGWRHRR